jgi:hypothetical protein
MLVSACGFGLVKFGLGILENRGFDFYIMNLVLSEKYDIDLLVSRQTHSLLC